MGKGEIACHEQILLFQQCFQKTCTADSLNSLPNNKILDLSKLEAFENDNLNVYQKLKFALGRVENILGKGENAGYQHFLLFPKMFSKASFLRVVKSRDCVVKS